MDIASGRRGAPPATAIRRNAQTTSVVDQTTSVVEMKGALLRHRPDANAKHNDLPSPLNFRLFTLEPTWSRSRQRSLRADIKRSHQAILGTFPDWPRRVWG